MEKQDIKTKLNTLDAVNNTMTTLIFCARLKAVQYIRSTEVQCKSRHKMLQRMSLTFVMITYWP